MVERFIYNPGTRSFSKTKIGGLTSWLIGGLASVIGTKRAGKYYDLYINQGYSPREAQRLALKKARKSGLKSTIALGAVKGALIGGPLGAAIGGVGMGALSTLGSHIGGRLRIARKRDLDVLKSK